MKKLNVRGFSHIEAVILLVVVGLISTIGFYVFNKSLNSNAETAVKPVPVYRVRVNYKNSKTLNYYNFIVGTKAMKKFVKGSKGTAKNHGVAFVGLPSKKSGSNDTSALVYHLEKGIDSTQRNDVSKSIAKAKFKTLIFTTSDAVTKKLLKNYDFNNSSERFRAFTEKSIYYKDLKPIARMWKKVTPGGQRVYQYVTNKAHFKQLVQDGYKMDGEILYVPQAKKYCVMKKSKNYGEICTPKNYPLPNLAKFRAYITALENARLAEERRIQAQLSNSSYSGSSSNYNPADAPVSGGDGGGRNNDSGRNCYWAGSTIACDSNDSGRNCYWAGSTVACDPEVRSDGR